MTKTIVEKSIYQIAQSAEQTLRSMLPIRNHKPLLPMLGHLIKLNDGSLPLDYDIEQLLIDILCVLCCLLHETLLPNLFQLRLVLIRVRVRKLALVHKVTAQLLLLTARERASRAESLDTVATAAFGLVEILFIDSLLVLRTINHRDAWFACVDVDGVVGGFLVETNFEPLIVTSVCCDLCSVERMDVIYYTE